MGGLRVTVVVGPEMAGDGSGAGCAERRTALPARRWAVKPAAHHVSKAAPVRRDPAGASSERRRRQGSGNVFRSPSEGATSVAAKLPEDVS